MWAPKSPSRYRKVDDNALLFNPTETHRSRSPEWLVTMPESEKFTPPVMVVTIIRIRICPIALLGSAFYLVLVHRLAIYAPRFLSTFGRPHAVALHFIRCDQLMVGLAPAGGRPCWAHKENAAGKSGVST